jgi:predicted nucleotidyltransferase
VGLRALASKNRTALFEAAARHGARNIRLVGSVARGDDGASGDIDLLVDFEPGRSLFDPAALLIELEALLGRRV